MILSMFKQKQKSKVMIWLNLQLKYHLKKIQVKYEEETPEEDRGRDDLYKLFDEIEIPMKMDPSTKHFICKRCGLYATREQISDIRYKLNQKERTRDDKHDDYLEWWSKSKKDKNLDA